MPRRALGISCRAVSLASLATLGLTAPAAHADTVRGWVLLGPDARVSGARIDVRTEDGRSLLTPGAPVTRTTKAGTFHATVTALPKRYVVVAVGGKAGGRRINGKLSQLLTPRRATDFAHISPISSIVAERAQLIGSLSRAEQQVRRLIRHPAGLSLYASVRGERTAFDGERFLTVARKHGGVDRYVRALARADQRTAVTFRGEPNARRAGDTPGGGPGAAAAQWIANRVANGAANYAISQVLDVFGMGGGSSDLAAIRQQLEEIKRELQQLNVELTQIEQKLAAIDADLKQSEYSTLVGQLGLTFIGGPKDPVFQNLQFLVDDLDAGVTPESANPSACAADATACLLPLPAGTSTQQACSSSAPTPASPVPGAFSDICSLVSAAQQLVSNPDVLEYQDRLMGVAGADGVLEAFLQARTARLRATHAMVTPQYAADFTVVADRFAFVSALLGTYQAIATLTAPDASPARAQRFLDDAAADVKAQAALAPPALPENSFVDPTAGTYWALAPETPACTVKGAKYLTSWTGSLPGYATCRILVDQAAAITLGEPGLSLPETKALGPLLDQANKSGKPNLGAWLHTSAGLPDLSHLTDRPALPAPNTSTKYYREVSRALTSGIGAIARAKVAPNAGSNASLATSSCRSERHNGGWGNVIAFSGRVGEIDGTFCDIVRLDTGKTVDYCLEATTKLSPCGFPALTMRKFDGSYAFGHPSVWLLTRERRASDHWFYG